jgi:hypothetical protein
MRGCFSSILIVAAAAGLAAVPAGAATLRVEVDWLAAAGHNHKPTQCELDAVRASFLAQGIDLQIELSDEITEDAANQILDFNAAGNFDGGLSPEWEALEATYRDHAVGSGWHYCVFAHNYRLGTAFTTSSGLSEIVGDEFIVTLGSFSGQVGTPFDRAGTFMHELGHNLSLRHAGNQNESLVRQYKPNFPSLMAYRYQLWGVKNGLLCQGLASAAAAAAFKELDYSHGTLASRDENALEECQGIGLGTGVDWNCAGGISACGIFVAKDVSSAGGGIYGENWCSAAGGLQVITDYDDWANVTDVASHVQATVESASCITLEESQGGSVILACSAQPDPCDQTTEVRTRSTWGGVKTLYR